jgi:hypothetical protein
MKSNHHLNGFAAVIVLYLSFPVTAHANTICRTIPQLGTLCADLTKGPEAQVHLNFPNMGYQVIVTDPANETIKKQVGLFYRGRMLHHFGVYTRLSKVCTLFGFDDYVLESVVEHEVPKEGYSIDITALIKSENDTGAQKPNTSGIHSGFFGKTFTFSELNCHPFTD